jgi:hypothetical protein
MAKLTKMQEAFVRSAFNGECSTITKGTSDGEIFKLTRNFVDNMKESGIILEEQYDFYKAFKNLRDKRGIK